MQRLLRLAARWSGVLLSVVFLYLTFRKVNLTASLHALQQANYWYVLLGSAIYLTSFLPRGLRWRRLLWSVHQPPLSHLVRVLLIGFMANNVLPLRLGEFFRAYVLGVKERISSTTSFATIVLERIADGLTLVALLSIITTLYPFPTWVRRSGMLAALLFLGALGFLLVLTHRKPLIFRLLSHLTRRLPPNVAGRLTGTLSGFAAGLDFLRNVGDVLAVIALSIVIWGFELTVYTCVTRLAFGIVQPLYVVLLLLIIINFSILVPSAPAYVGPFQAAAVAVLTQVANVPKSTALSVAWVLWAAMVLPVIAIGLALLSMENLSLFAVTRQTAGIESVPRLPVNEQV